MKPAVEQLKGHLEKSVELAEEICDADCDQCPLSFSEHGCDRYELKWILSHVRRYILAEGAKKSGRWNA